jgi:hypothetical protein
MPADPGETRPSPDVRSRWFAAPRQSHEHQQLRLEMIEMRILGSEGACRYCLSVLTGEDCFSLAPKEILARLSRFVARHTSPKAEALCRDMDAFHFLADFMVNLLYQAERSGSPRRSKEHRAIELLLRDLELSDKVIQERLSTTEKQMRRWAD